MVSLFGFSDQDMKVFPHDHVAHYFELVFAPDLLEDAEKHVSCMPGTE